MQKGDIGVSIEVDVGIDVTLATVAQIEVMKPSGKKVKWDAVASGTILTYVTKENDIDEIGVYEIQAYVEVGSFKGRGKRTTFDVYEIIDNGTSE